MRKGRQGCWHLALAQERGGSRDLSQQSIREGKLASRLRSLLRNASLGNFVHVRTSQMFIIILKY